MHNMTAVVQKTISFKEITRLTGPAVSNESGFHSILPNAPDEIRDAFLSARKLTKVKTSGADCCYYESKICEEEATLCCLCLMKKRLECIYDQVSIA